MIVSRASPRTPVCEAWGAAAARAHCCLIVRANPLDMTFFLSDDWRKRQNAGQSDCELPFVDYKTLSNLKQKRV